LPDGEGLYEVHARGTGEAGVLFFSGLNGTILFLMCLSTFSTKHFNGETGFLRQTGKNRADSQQRQFHVFPPQFDPVNQ
jgi:hypothetical protein